MASDAKPTFHHLSNSQSQRILWLLEELEIPYNLDLHKRQQNGPNRGRAPPELKKTHPLGKSPQLTTAEGRVISESSAIAKYLIERYDKAGKFKGDEDKNDWLRDEELCSLAGTTFMPTETLDLVFSHITKRCPFFIRPIFSAAHKQLQKVFVGPELINLCCYLNDQLGDQDYFMGSNPGRADFILSWPIDLLVRMIDEVKLQDYSKLYAWHERCKAREGWKRSLEKGNGYLGPSMSIDFVDDE